MDRSSCCGSTRGCLGTSCRHQACALHPPREPIPGQGGGPPRSHSPGDKNPRGTSTNRHLLSIAMWTVGCTGLVAVLLAAAVAAEAKEVLEFKPEIGVSNGGLWGAWAWQEMCPEETYATGFSLKVTSVLLTQRLGFRGLSPDRGGCPLPTTLARLFSNLNSPKRRKLFPIVCGGVGVGRCRSISGILLADPPSPSPPQVEAYRGPMDDDTALNGIRLFCTRGGRGDKHEAHTVESQSGPWGQWSPPSWCPEGTYLTRFSLRVEQTRRGIHDDMGATNARFACSGEGAHLEGRGLSWGEYGEWSPPCRKGLCGIQTKQDPVRGALRDDTALNDVRFFCCSR
nr:uncharacterized protein LOC118078321 [Zootoca vivipara]